MNFLVSPTAGITLNSPMTEDQQNTAIDFMEELIQLGVLELAQQGEILTNCPLFILPKPGQPGQWRVLADMKKGGQNEAVGKDPVYLNRPGNILPQMYAADGVPWVTHPNAFTNSQPTARTDPSLE